jgi:hypothetical protein
MKVAIMGSLNRNQTIALITSVGVLLAGTIAVVEYLNTRRHRELQQKNAELENKIKQLQLVKLTSELEGNG